ncbi:MAG: OsmC family protein [Burkholderiales bacterium]
MPVALGGGATAPNPGWFMRASLAACNATAIALRAAQRGIALTAIEVKVSSESDTRGMLGLGEQVHLDMDQLRVSVRVGASGVQEAELRELVTWAISHSPVGCTDLDSAELHVEVVRGPGPSIGA